MKLKNNLGSGLVLSLIGATLFLTLGLKNEAVLKTVAEQKKGMISEQWEKVATFSILGYDPETGEVGGAVQSRVFLCRQWSSLGRS